MTNVVVDSEGLLVSHFAKEIKTIIDNGQAGPYTWAGLLWSFHGAMDLLKERGSVTFVEDK